MTTQPTTETPPADATPAPAPAPTDQYSSFFAERDATEDARLEVDDFEILLGQRPPRDEVPPTPTPAPTPTPTPAATPSAAEPTPGNPSPTPAPAAPPAAPTAAPPAAAEPSEVELLRQTVAQMQAKINELSAPKPQASGTPQPAGGGNPQPATPEPAADAMPEYLVQVPDQLVEDLSDEDPAKRKQALMGLIAGVGKLVHQQLRAEYRPYVEAQLGQFRQRASQESNEEVIRNDFFGAFPHLNKPEYMVTLGLVMQQVLNETGAKAWTQEVRDAVGARMNRLINHQPAPAADPTQGGDTPPTSVSPAPAAPSLVSPRSAPPSRPAPTGDISAEIMDTLR